MFTVYNKETKRIFRVFNVWVATTNDNTKFLIFDKEWKWVDAGEYVPSYYDLSFE